MRIFSKIPPEDAKKWGRQGESGFTMVEIAIAIGVIGFALVGIIGILPAGLNEQKDSREDTVISQDAPYFLDAIRNGVVLSNGYAETWVSNFGYFSNGQNLDFLTNYVQSIQVVKVFNGTSVFTNTYPNTNNPYLNGAEIIGLLSAPQTNYNSPYFSSNYFDTIATVRALSGPASAQQNGSNTALSSQMAFTYQMEVMITPFNSFAPDTTNWSAYYNNPDTNQFLMRSNRWLEANYGPTISNSFQPFTGGSGGLQMNLFEVRLRFSWPVFQNGSVGSGRQTYRTLLSSQLAQATVNGVTNLWFFQPQTYTNNFPTNAIF